MATLAIPGPSKNLTLFVLLPLPSKRVASARHCPPFSVNARVYTSFVVPAILYVEVSESPVPSKSSAPTLTVPSDPIRSLSVSELAPSAVVLNTSLVGASLLPGAPST